MLSALYEALTGRGPDLFRAYFLAVAIQALAVPFIAGLSHPSVSPPPFLGLVTALGGILYGLGMVLAVGCAAAVLYRAGEGKLDYLFATGGFGLGAWAGLRWLAGPIRGLLEGRGAALALHDVLPVRPWLTVSASVILLVAAMSVGRSGVSRDPRRWGWRRTGTALGLAGVGALLASALTGHAVKLGLGEGHGSLAGLLAGDADAVDYGVFVALGVVGGSVIASRLHGTSPGSPFRPERAVRSVAGGLLMGLSAALVAGDNLLHGLRGVPLLAVSSLIFMPGMFLGAWIGIRLGWLGAPRRAEPGRSRPTSP